MKSVIYLLFMLFFLVGCGSMMTKEDAMEILSEKSVYRNYFYAPIHIGKQIVTLDEGVQLNDYLKERYGELEASGLVQVDIQSKSSWRNVYTVKLTEQGSALLDSRRSNSEHAFVAVCKIVPVRIDTLISLGENSVQCRYIIQQRDITPFGKFLEYEDGKTFQVTDTLIN